MVRCDGIEDDEQLVQVRARTRDPGVRIGYRPYDAVIKIPLFRVQRIVCGVYIIPFRAGTVLYDGQSLEQLEHGRQNYDRPHGIP